MNSDWKPIISTHIQSARYDEDTQTLGIRFHDLGEYEFQGIPKDVADGIFSAGSPGRYFAQNIKGRYEYNRQ